MTILILTRRVSTGASVLMWDFSITAGNMSFRGDTLLEAAMLNLLIAFTVCGLKDLQTARMPTMIM